ncbi:uncharacterized protein LOC132785128 [Drosophila nasuta]|uniref:uncharacterized protein LOC132785128 n=1 Tax=Drosophila nasuta TaxID=42062 RepID=UPI00295F3C68|nr:uncharacterized protein LOC132785128 [Drosophila nasuta]
MFSLLALPPLIQLIFVYSLKLLVIIATALALLPCIDSNSRLLQAIENSLQAGGQRQFTNCGTFSAKYHGHETCEKKICGKGDAVVGTWCGRGRCNPRGCHCRNGCLTGEAVASFRLKHGPDNFVYMGYA